MPVVARKIRTSVLGVPRYAFDHPCDHPGCGKWGLFGFGVKLREQQGGRWFCGEHRADGEDGGEVAGLGSGDLGAGRALGG